MAARLFDPLTGDVAGAGRTEFVDSIIPANRISPIAAKVMALVPLPNLPGYADNYYASGPGVLNRDNYDFKVNWVRSPKNTIWGKYSRMNAFTHCEPAEGSDWRRPLRGHRRCDHNGTSSDPGHHLCFPLPRFWSTAPSASAAITTLPTEWTTGPTSDRTFSASPGTKDPLKNKLSRI